MRLLLLMISLSCGAVFAQTNDELKNAVTAVQKNTDIIWTIIAASLVFFMQAGFAMVETGFTRAKNAGNIMMKNLMDFCMGGLAYWAVGFGLMFGISNGFSGWSHFFVNFDNGGVDGQWGFTFWLFQVVFAATAATIVSGAMAERTKFSGYLIYSFFISLFIYPMVGHWAWGNLFVPANAESGAWLAKRGFIDFAGSTVVVDGRRSRERSLWVLALVSTLRTESRASYRVTASRWPPLACSFCFLAGSGSIPVRRQLPMAAWRGLR
jgi:ammonium transporter, Amt family